jgi:hypothetical protein
MRIINIIEHIWYANIEHPGSVFWYSEACSFSFYITPFHDDSNTLDIAIQSEHGEILDNISIPYDTTHKKYWSDPRINLNTPSAENHHYEQVVTTILPLLVRYATTLVKLHNKTKRNTTTEKK